MKPVIRIVLIVLVAMLAFVQSRPSHFRVERTAVIGAPAEVVFAKIDDFHQWAGWSPWEKLDPAMKRVYGDIPAGTGATYHWTGNDKVGEGNMAITDSRPGELVVIALEFIKPFKASNVTTFALATEASGTRVTWSMDGTHDLMGKAMSIFMNMDKMVGGDFEKGLANLKALAEADAQRPAEVATPALTGEPGPPAR